jgi:dienelactone hydrolase
VAAECPPRKRRFAGDESEPRLVRGPFYGTFLGANAQDHDLCNESSPFVYYLPMGNGPFPLAVYFTGTLGDYDGWESHLNLQRLAARGYLAAAPDYGQDHALCSFYCSCYAPKANCASDPDLEGSLVSVLQRDAAADTSLGFVTWGHSQGGYVAVLAGDRNANLTRALATGTADPLGGYPCMEPGTRRLSSASIRFMIGESDEVTPPSQAADTPTASGFITQLASLTEQPACAASGAYACLREDGSGYYIVSNNEAADGEADHRYYIDHDQDGSSPRSLSQAYRSEWRSPWSLDAVVDWLTGSCGDGICAPTETHLTCSLDC